MNRRTIVEFVCCTSFSECYYPLSKIFTYLDGFIIVWQQIHNKVLFCCYVGLLSAGPVIATPF